MKQICRKTVLEFRYDSEEEAGQHETIMRSQGWSVESKKSYFIKNFRSYSQTIPEGIFL